MRRHEWSYTLLQTIGEETSTLEKPKKEGIHQTYNQMSCTRLSYLFFTLRLPIWVYK